MKPLPFLGGGVAGKSYTVTRQRKLNCYVEQRPDGDKGVKVVVYGTPGLRPLFTISPVLSSPVRGLLGTPAQLFAVSGFAFMQLNIVTGAVLFTSPIISGSGQVEMAHSPNQGILVDGVLGYLYNGATLAVIGGAFPAGAKTITFVAGFYVAELPGTNQFYVSALFDGTTWPALAFASAAQYSDTLLACDNLGGNLILFSQLHMEFWQNVGANPQPFAPILSATNEWGLAAIFSRLHVNQKIYFLAVSRTGRYHFCEVEGYNVKDITSPDIAAIINDPAFGRVSDCVGMSYEVDKHGMAQWTFPSADRTFFYDTLSYEWGETQTGHTTKYATRHLGNLSTLCANQMVVADVSSGTLYTLDPTIYTDNGQVIERELITRAAIDGYNDFTIDETYLDMEVGVGLVSGQGSDPQIGMSVSRDNGKTWETELQAGMGRMGEYLVRAVWRRWGTARVFHFKTRMTDPVKFVIAGAGVSARGISQ